MYAAGTYGLAETVVCVVQMIREIFFPPCYKAWGNRLRADVHKSPPVGLIVRKLYLSAFNSVQNVLCPGYQQPHDSTFLRGHRVQNSLGLNSAQEHGFASRKERAEPVHFGSRMVQGRNAQEDVVLGLTVVVLLNAGGVHKAHVPVQYRLGEACCSRGKIYSRKVVVRKLDIRRNAGAVCGKPVVVLRKCWTVPSRIKEKPVPAYIVGYLLDSAYKFRTENKHVAFGQIEAVLDLLGGIAEVKRHRQRSRFKYSEIDRQPFETVHEQYGYLVSLFDSAAQQQVCKAVRLFVEDVPCDLASVVA